MYKYIRNQWYKLRYGHTYDDFILLGEMLAEANRKREIAFSRMEKMHRIPTKASEHAKKRLKAIQGYYPDFE